MTLSKNKIIALLIIILFIPTLNQYIATYFQDYFIGLALRIIIHVILPIIGVMLITKVNIKEAFLTPLRPKKQSLLWGTLGSAGALILILGAFLILKHTMDFSAITSSLNEGYGVNITNYLIVASLIVLVNPFIEEYFWRGFIYRAFNKYTKGWINTSLFYLTGLFFSLHHTIIFKGWFNWWQWTLVTVFLAAVGVLFNWMYKKTNAIYAGWMTHTAADIIIVIIGFFILF